MLQVENISFSYRKGRKEVLSDFSLSLEAGRVYGLLGKNGAGKSTLLYLMSGIMIPTCAAGCPSRCRTCFWYPRSSSCLLFPWSAILN